MSVKLLFEIGHLASRKTKPSKEGFTHDWELFVRGHEGSDIGHFVEKVVFNLHDSFPKPKRVINKPPYSVKEAGYAGFVLTIDICLKNRDEPKKVTYEYDLDLQPFKTQTNEFVVVAPTDEFKRKCLKGGCVLLNPGDYKSREPYKNPPMPPAIDPKKMVKRPEEAKANKTFTDLFGAPLKKPDPRAIQSASPNPSKLQAPSKGDKIPPPSAPTKEKSEKSKHKHSPNKDGKESKKSIDSKSDLPEKSKKDKKDRDRSDRKEKVPKRPSSPSPSSQPPTSSRNSTNLTALPPSKPDSGKSQSKQQSSTPVPTSDPTFSKKSSKKDKKSDRNEKKESRSKESFSSKEKFEPVPKKGNSAPKDREPLPTKDEREKGKAKSSVSAEPKNLLVDSVKKLHDKEAERKNKHKKKEKTKDNDMPRESKKEKQHKSSPIVPSPVKAKEPAVIKYEQTAAKSHLSDKDSSDSDADSPPSIKQESDNNSISEPIVQKPPPEVEKSQKKARERMKTSEKEEKSRKRKSSKKDDRDFSVSPPPSKQPRKDVSKSPSLHDRPSSSDSAAHHSHNNNNLDSGSKLPSEYMTELKDLKHKITTLKNNDELQTVVRMIAATGCYEITKSSFDFDLVQLDRTTVQRLQEFFTNS